MDGCEVLVVLEGAIILLVSVAWGFSVCICICICIFICIFRWMDGGEVLDVLEGAIILLVSVAWGFLASGHPARCHRQNTPTRPASKHLHFTFYILLCTLYRIHQPAEPQSIYILHPQPTSLWENSQDSAKSLFIAISLALTLLQGKPIFPHPPFQDLWNISALVDLGGFA